MTPRQSLVPTLCALALLVVAAPSSLGSAAAPAATTGPAAKHCRWIVRRIHGKRRRVRRCKPALPSAGKVVAAIAVGGSPLGLAVTADAVWVAQHRAATIARIDPSTNRVVAHVKVVPDGSDAQPARFVVADGFLWELSYSGNTLVRIDPATNTAAATVALPKENCCRAAAGAGSIWVLGADDSGGALTRLDPATGAVQATIPLGGVDGVAFADGAAWVISGSEKSLWRIDPATNAVAAEYPIQIPQVDDYFLSAGAGSIWITAGDKVARFDLASKTITATFSIPDASPVAADDHAAWVASERQISLKRINLATNKIDGQVRLPYYGGYADLEIGPDSSLWLTVFNSDRVLRIRPKQ